MRDASLSPNHVIKKKKSAVSAPEPKESLRTAQVCRVAGVTRGALRLYERRGLIRPHSRSRAGYRAYSADAVQRLQAIKIAKELGLSLKEIAEVFDLADERVVSTASLRRMARTRVAEIDRRLARLAMVRAFYADFAEGRADEDEECAFLVRFITGESSG